MENVQEPWNLDTQKYELHLLLYQDILLRFISIGGEKSTLRQIIITFNMYKHSNLHNNTGNVKIQYQSHIHRSKGKELLI
jgi:hypothetical protein